MNTGEARSTHIKCDTFDADTLPSYSSEATDPQYVVALDVGRGGSERPAPGWARVLAMKDKHGRKFSCRIPEVDSTDGDDTGDAESLVREPCTSSAGLLGSMM